MPRKVYDVVPDGTGWAVTSDGMTVASSPRKAEATEGAKRLAMANQPSEVHVHRFDGSPEAVWTYGDGPAER
jgi:Uncharacterized protein conserved in bacteria (DUF2188)